MEFKDIEYALAVAKYHSITKAADSLYITQPTLSTYLKNMEKRLGIELFNRDGNKFTLSYEGELFIEEGKKILAERDNLMNRMLDSLQCQRGRLKIAIPLLRGSYLIPMILPKFHEKYPNVEILLTEGSSPELEKHVREGLCDLVIYNKPSHELPFPYESLHKEEMLLVMNKKNPLAKKGKKIPGLSHLWMDLSLCQGEPFIMHLPSQHTGQIERDLLKKFGVKPHVVLETKNLEASYHLAANGYGLTFISECHTAHIIQEKNAVFFSVGSPRTEMELIAGYLNRDALSNAARDFIEISKTIFQEESLAPL